MAPRTTDQVRTRPCRHCGEPFTPTRPLQVFCKPSCRLQHLKVDGQRRLPLDDPADLFIVPFE